MGGHVKGRLWGEIELLPVIAVQIAQKYCALKRRGPIHKRHFRVHCEAIDGKFSVNYEPDIRTIQ